MFTLFMYVCAHRYRAEQAAPMRHPSGAAGSTRSGGTAGTSHGSAALVAALEQTNRIALRQLTCLERVQALLESQEARQIASSSHVSPGHRDVLLTQASYTYFAIPYFNQANVSHGLIQFIEKDAARDRVSQELANHDACKVFVSNNLKELTLYVCLCSAGCFVSCRCYHSYRAAKNKRNNDTARRLLSCYKKLWSKSTHPNKPSAEWSPTSREAHAQFIKLWYDLTAPFTYYLLIPGSCYERSTNAEASTEFWDAFLDDVLPTTTYPLSTKSEAFICIAMTKAIQCQGLVEKHVIPLINDVVQPALDILHGN